MAQEIEDRIYYPGSLIPTRFGESKCGAYIHLSSGESIWIDSAPSCTGMYTIDDPSIDIDNIEEYIETKCSKADLYKIKVNVSINDAEKIYELKKLYNHVIIEPVVDDEEDKRDKVEEETKVLTREGFVALFPDDLKPDVTGILNRIGK